MISGEKASFAIEAVVERESGEWRLGRFRFWICGEAVGDWEDSTDLNGCAEWLRLFSSTNVNRFEPLLVSASPADVFRLAYDPVMSGGDEESQFPDAYSRFHLSYIGMSAFDRYDLLLVHDAHGRARCLWRSVDDPRIRDCWLPAGAMEAVATDFCAQFAADRRSRDP